MKYKYSGLTILIAALGLGVATPAYAAGPCTEAQASIGMQTFGDTCVVPHQGTHWTPGYKSEDGSKDYKAPKIVGDTGVAHGWGAKVGDTYLYDATPVYGCDGGWTASADGQCTQVPSDTGGEPTCPTGSTYTDGVCTKAQGVVSRTCANGTPDGNDKCTGYKPVKAGTALGAATSVQANHGTAVGAGATVGEGHTGSTALGAGAATTKANQVMIGTANDTVTAPGIAMRTGAGMAIVTVDEEGNLANDGGAVYSTLDSHGQRIGTLEGRADANDTKNTEQDGRLDGHDAKLADHSGRIKATEDKNGEQDETLKQHDGRITKVQTQADATDGRLNSYNGTGNTIEHWSSGVDSWRSDVNAWRGDVDYALANHGSRLNALEDWRSVAEGQIAVLQGDVKRLHRAIAVATAITIPHVDPDKRFALTVSGAGVDGEGAGAIAAAIKFDRNIQGFVGAGTSFSGGPAAVKGGVTFQW